MLDRLKRWARALKLDILALAIAARDPRTPGLAKALAIVVVAYAFSPIDLIPDFVPVLGYLDDLLLLPLGILAAVRLIPEPLMAEFRRRAAEQAAGRRRYWLAAAIIIALWLALAAALAVLVMRTAS